MYSKEDLDFKKYSEQNECPENDKLCMEAVWLPQFILLADKTDLDKIPEAIEKIRMNAEEIKNIK
jgi:perosamine synthetase